MFQLDTSYNFLPCGKNVILDEILKSHHTDIYLPTFDPLYGIARQLCNESCFLHLAVCIEQPTALSIGLPV